jgi:flagellar hook assembly protein FlgD
VAIFNVTGHTVKSLYNQVQQPGIYNLKWNGTDENGVQLASGVYFYTLQTGGFSKSMKMVLMK